MKETKVERRAHPRLKGDLPVEVEHHRCRLVDISRGGLRLIGPMRKLPATMRIRLRNLDQIIHLDGAVRWSQIVPAHGGSREMGLCVTQAPREYSRLLDRLERGFNGRIEYGWILIVLSVMLLVGLLFGISTLLDLVRL